MAENGGNFSIVEELTEKKKLHLEYRAIWDSLWGWLESDLVS